MALTLNADLGESWYGATVGNDAVLMPLLDTCNIACGLHGGDALTMQRTVELALRNGVRIGAHPSFPDRKHFGRRAMDPPPDRLYALLLYQVGALQSMVRIAGAELHHLKPHGALYHYADADPVPAGIVVRVARELGIGIIYGPPAGNLSRQTGRRGLTFHAEGFADRRYEPTLLLRSRQQPDACIDLPGDAAEQARLLAAGQVEATDGEIYTLEVQTICIHGDHPGAVARAAAVREALGAIPPR